MEAGATGRREGAEGCNMSPAGCCGFSNGGMIAAARHLPATCPPRGPVMQNCGAALRKIGIISLYLPE